MNNPFEVIDARLSNIETLLLDLTNPPKENITTEPQDQFLTIQEAAEFLKLSVPTLYSKVSKMELPVMKRGKRLYFSRMELIEYLKQGRTKTRSEIAAESESFISNKKGLHYGKR